MAELVAELRCDVFERFAPVVAFNVVGTVDIIGDYYHGYQLGLADLAASRRRLRNRNDLRASADDNARRRVLFADAPSVQSGWGRPRPAVRFD